MSRQMLTKALLEASRRVLANWADGDLAATVRELSGVVAEYDSAIFPGDLVRSVETHECFVMVGESEPDGDITMVEVLGINHHAIKLGGQSIEGAIEYDDRRWFAINDVAFVGTSIIPPEKLAGWRKQGEK